MGLPWNSNATACLELEYLCVVFSANSGFVGASSAAASGGGGGGSAG